MQERPCKAARASEITRKQLAAKKVGKQRPMTLRDRCGASQGKRVVHRRHAATVSRARGWGANCCSNAPLSVTIFFLIAGGTDRQASSSAPCWSSTRIVARVIAWWCTLEELSCFH